MDLKNKFVDNKQKNREDNLQLVQIDMHINAISKKTVRDDVINWFQQSPLHWLIGLHVVKYDINNQDLSKQELVDQINEHVVMEGKKTVTTEFRYIEDAESKGYIVTSTSKIDARKKIIKPTEKMLLSMKKWFSSFNNDWKRLLEC